MKTIGQVIGAALCLALAGAAAAADSGQTNATRFGLAFVPMKDDEQLAFTARHLDALGVRMIRFDESWIYREPEPGKYLWGSLDLRMKFAREHGIEILMTLPSLAPGWACGEPSNETSCVFRNEDDFRAYVTAILQRYPGQIDMIQFGNEWQSEYGYAGSAEDFVRFNNVLFDAVKEQAPETQVVLGGFSIGSLRGLAAMSGRLDYFCDGGRRKVTGAELEVVRASPRALRHEERVGHVLRHAKYDVLDLHLYGDAEEWPIYVEMMRERAPGKPIVVSEFGGPNLFLENDSDEYQAERLKVYFETLRALGVSKAFYFKLVQSKGMTEGHRKSSLIDEALRLKPAYETFRILNGGMGERLDQAD